MFRLFYRECCYTVILKFDPGYLAAAGFTARPQTAPASAVHRGKIKCICRRYWLNVMHVLAAPGLKSAITLVLEIYLPVITAID